VKRLFALLAGGLGLGALLRRRRPLASPADDLRLKLAEARTATPEPQQEEAVAPVEAPVVEAPGDEEPEPEEQGGAPESDVARRRAEVHERARRAIDELQ
jgi:hypothetical protein